MIRELLYKWFQLEECRTCQILQISLDTANREKEFLLRKLLEGNEPIPAAAEATVEYKPIPTTRSRYIPAVVRQQMMDREDQRTLQLLVDKKKELTQSKVVEERIEELEKEVIGETDASEISKAV